MSTMLVAERPAGGQTSPPATPAQPEPTTTRRSPLPILGRAPEVLLISCVGVLVVAWGYARGRAGQPGAEALYWLGQALVFLPVAVRLLARRLAGGGEPFALAIGLAVNQYLLKWLYSPDQLKFPDELQHWALTTTLVDKGRLFVPDPALPAAVRFPGLEEMGAAVVTLTGLPVTAAGLLVAGVAHLTFVGALFALTRRIFGSAAVAGLSCVVYATGVHYLFFDSMYLYQTAALPFAVLAVWAVKRWRRDDRRTAPFALVGAVSMVVVTVSHHVTALVLVATLGLLAGCERVAGRRRREPLLAFGFAVVVVAAWIGFVARDVVGYLGAPVLDLLSTARGVLTGHGFGTVGTGALWQQAVQGTALLALLTVFVRVGVAMRRAGQRDPWRWALLAGAGTFFVAGGLRFLGTDGPELAGRAATFTYLPLALLTGAALVRMRSAKPAGHPTRRPVNHRILVGSALLALLTVAARVGGWPPVWAQLPGPYLVSGYERSVDPAGVAAARWLAATAPPGQRVAADLTGWTLVSTYGRQDPVGEASELYYATDWTEAANQKRWDLAVDFLWVDLRLSEQTPRTGSYFPADPRAGQHDRPLTRDQLEKFDNIAGFSRVYDNGRIRIYDMEG